MRADDPIPAATSRIQCDVDFARAGKQAGYLRVPNSVNDSAYGTVLIPIWTIGQGRGPTILFTGGVHGDEYEGPVALSKLARQLQAEAIRGTVILIPCLNPPAMQAGARLSPLDNLNLNRVFPGDRDGSVSMMIAHFIDALLLPRVDYQVDLHSGGKTLEFLPMEPFQDNIRLCFVLELVPGQQPCRSRDRHHPGSFAACRRIQRSPARRSDENCAAAP